MATAEHERRRHLSMIRKHTHTHTCALPMPCASLSSHDGGVRERATALATYDPVEAGPQCLKKSLKSSNFRKIQNSEF